MGIDAPKWVRVFILSFLLSLILVSFQNCRSFESSQNGSSTKLDGGDGGDNYDGKPLEGTYVHEVLQFSCGGEFSQYEQQVISISKGGDIGLDGKSLIACSEIQKNLNSNDLEYYRDAKGYFSYNGAIFKHKDLLRKDWVTELWCRPAEESNTNNIFLEYSPLHNKAELTQNSLQRMDVRRTISGSTLIAENQSWNLLVNLDSEVFLGSRKYIGQITNKDKSTKNDVYCFSGANTLPRTTFKRVHAYPSTRDQYISISANQNSTLSLDWLLSNLFDENKLTLSQMYFKNIQALDGAIKISLTNLSNGKEFQRQHPIIGWTYYGSYMVDDKNLVLISVNLGAQDLSIPHTEQSLLPIKISHFQINENELQLQNEFESSTLFTYQNLLTDRRNLSRVQIFLSLKTIQWVSITNDFHLKINNYSTIDGSLDFTTLNLNEFLPESHVDSQRILNISNAFGQEDLYTESVRQLPGSLWRIMSRRNPLLPLTDQLPRSMEKVIFASSEGLKVTNISDWNTETFHNKFKITKNKVVYYFVDQMDSPENGVYTKYKIYKFDPGTKSTLEVQVPSLQNFILSEVTFDQRLDRMYIIAVDHLNRFSDYSRSMFILDPETLILSEKIPVYRYEYRQYFLTERPELAYLLKAKISSTSSRLDSVNIRDLKNFSYDYKIFDFKDHFSATEIQSIYFNAKIYESLNLNNLFLTSHQYFESESGLIRKNNLYELRYDSKSASHHTVYEDLSFAESISSSRLVLTKNINNQTDLFLYDINQKRRIDLVKNITASESERVFNIIFIPNTNALMVLTQSLAEKKIYLNVVSVDGL